MRYCKIATIVETVLGPPQMSHYSIFCTDLSQRLRIPNLIVAVPRHTLRDRVGKGLPVPNRTISTKRADHYAMPTYFPQKHETSIMVVQLAAATDSCKHWFTTGVQSITLVRPTSVKTTHHTRARRSEMDIASSQSWWELTHLKCWTLRLRR